MKKRSCRSKRDEANKNMFILLTIFAMLNEVQAWKGNAFIRSMDPVIESQNLSGLLKAHLGLALSYTFPRGLICTSVISDDSSYAMEIMKLMYTYPRAPSFLSMPLEFEKDCKSYIVVVSDIVALKRVMVKIKRYSKIRIACFMEKTSEEELERTLEHDMEIFGDVEFSIFAWMINDVFYRVRQPNRVVEKIDYKKAKGSTWRANDGLIKNFHRRTIRITSHNCTAFTKFGPLKADKTSDYFVGNDALPFQEIIDRLNLTFNFVQPALGSLYGDYINKTWVGGLFENLVTNKADVAVCGCWKDYSKLNTGLEPSFPLRSLCITYLVPRMKMVGSRWTRIFRPFHLTTWLILISSWFGLSWVISTVTALMINTGLSPFVDKRYRSLDRALFEVYGVIVNGAWPSSKTKLGPLRHIITWWVIFALLINCCYSSTLVSHLTKPYYKRKPSNIKDLLDSGYTWITERGFSYERLWDLKDPTYEKWGRRHKKTTYSKKIRALIYDKKQVIVGLKMFDNLFYPLYNEIPSHITQNFDIMDACMALVYETFIHRIGSPFITSFNHYIIALNEAGLIAYYERDSALSKMLPRPVQIDKNRNDKACCSSGGCHNNLSLHDLNGIFMWLILGYVVSVSAFFKELFWMRKHLQGNFNYA